MPGPQIIEGVVATHLWGSNGEDHNLPEQEISRENDDPKLLERRVGKIASLEIGEDFI